MKHIGNRTPERSSSKGQPEMRAGEILKLMNKRGKMVLYEMKELHQKLVLIIPKPNEDPAGDKTALVPPWFKPKAGSVFPAKRRSVNRMMLDSFIEFVARNFSLTGRHASSSASQSKNFR